MSEEDAKHAIALTQLCFQILRDQSGGHPSVPSEEEVEKMVRERLAKEAAGKKEKKPTKKQGGKKA